jgi:hypothetical protein
VRAVRKLYQPKSVSIGIPLSPIAPIFQHEHSGSDFVPAVESVLCLLPLTYPGNRAELRVPITQYVPPLIEESPALPGRVACHLLHPSLVWVARDSGQTDAAALQMNEEQDVVRHQTAPSEDLDREEVDLGQYNQMRLNEFLPRHVLAAFRRRRDAMPFQYIATVWSEMS